MNDELLSFIGICRKSGCLALGRSAVKENLQKGRVKLILTTVDLSDRSAKEINEICEKIEVNVIKINVSMEKMSYVLGKEFGMIGILNSDMANKINEIVLRNSKEECNL